jgi:hypothetical protein
MQVARNQGIERGGNIDIQQCLRRLVKRYPPERDRIEDTEILGFRSSFFDLLSRIEQKMQNQLASKENPFLLQVLLDWLNPDLGVYCR